MEGGDAVCRAVTRLKKDFEGSVDILEAPQPGTALYDVIAGYESVLILDSVKAASETGVVLEFSTESSPAVLPTSRYAGLPESPAAARRLGIPFPERLAILLVEPAAEATLPFLGTRAKQILEAWLDLESCQDAAVSAGV